MFGRYSPTPTQGPPAPAGIRRGCLPPWHGPSLLQLSHSPTLSQTGLRGLSPLTPGCPLTPGWPPAETKVLKSLGKQSPCGTRAYWGPSEPEVGEGTVVWPH